MPPDPMPPITLRLRGDLERPGGSFVAAIEAGGPLADLVARAEARDDARRDRLKQAARDVAGIIPPTPGDAEDLDHA